MAGPDARALGDTQAQDHGPHAESRENCGLYLEEHRDVYYQRLQSISREDNWNGWISFFLEALLAQARSNTAKTRQILDLYERMKVAVPKLTHSRHSIQAIDALFNRPVFRTSDFVQRTGILKESATRILSTLRDAAIVEEVRPQSGRRAALMVLSGLIEITEN